MNQEISLAIKGAAFTTLSLFGGLLLGVVVGSLTFNVLPGHDVQRSVVAAFPATAGFLAGSAAWGIAMGRLAHAADQRRMAIAGMAGFAPITLILAISLGALEPIAAARFGSQLPIHRLFTLFFVPTAFLIAGVSAWAIGVGLRNRPLAWGLLWRVGLAAALAFLVVNLIMESLGWVVGGPNAADRFTMLTVLFVGNLGAALAGGAVLGYSLGSS